MCTDLSLFPESLARTLLWFISGFLERDLIDGHIALHNTNLYGTLVRSYSLGCCSQSSVEASGLNLFMYKLFGLVHICCHLGLYTLGHLACTYLLPFGLVQFGPFGLVHICCHLGLYSLGHLGLYIFVAIWAIARPANNYYYVILY